MGVITLVDDNFEESYVSMLEPGSDSEIVFALDVTGLVLNEYEYGVFNRLLSVASGGTSACESKAGGYCLLQNSCASYESLWKYSFKIQFNSNTETLIVPLATFAVTMDEP